MLLYSKKVIAQTSQFAYIAETLHSFILKNVILPTFFVVTKKYIRKSSKCKTLASNKNN